MATVALAYCSELYRMLASAFMICRRSAAGNWSLASNASKSFAAATLSLALYSAGARTRRSRYFLVRVQVGQCVDFLQLGQRGDAVAGLEQVLGLVEWLGELGAHRGTGLRRGGCRGIGGDGGGGAIQSGGKGQRQQGARGDGSHVSPRKRCAERERKSRQHAGGAPGVERRRLLFSKNAYRACYADSGATNGRGAPRKGRCQAGQITCPAAAVRTR